MLTDIEQTLQKTFAASKSLQCFSDDAIHDLLLAIAKEIEADMASILKANRKDINKMAPTDALVDRLLLNEQRLHAIANAVRKVADLPSPTGKVILRNIKKGLELKKITVPFGVIGVIYESRPNVT